MKYLVLTLIVSALTFTGMALTGASTADLVGMAFCGWMVCCTWIVALAVTETT